MTLGTGIFLSAIFLGLIFLYHSTKDRWNWTKGMKRLGFLVLGLALLGGGVAAYNEYGPKSEYETKRDLENLREKVSKAREKAALPCLSKDVFRMEKIAKEIKEKIGLDMSFKEANKVIEGVLNTKVEVKPSPSNIKEWFSIGYIPTSCDFDFSFLINVNGKLSEKISSLGMWSKNTPQGYTKGRLKQFSVDFIKARQSRAVANAALRLKAKQAAKAKNRTTKKTRTNSKKQVATFPDHCAPGLDKKERLRRLALRGKLKQTSNTTYVLAENPSKFSLRLSGDFLHHCW